MEGNLTITFSVPKEEVLKKLATNSYYRGERVKDENGAHAARMQSGEDNNDVLNDELELAAADVVAMITRNLGRCLKKDDDAGNMLFETRAASNFPETMKESVEGAIAAYLFDKALEGWMLINMPAEVNNLAQRSVQDAEKLRLLLVEREKPMR